MWVEHQGQVESRRRAVPLPQAVQALAAGRTRQGGHRRVALLPAVSQRVERQLVENLRQEVWRVPVVRPLVELLARAEPQQAENLQRVVRPRAESLQQVVLQQVVLQQVESLRQAEPQRAER